ncbi:MAG: hypothetical protein M3Y64_03925, partial [Gemmatimonadota bacterium]|nr:hypothetical protein [Gemmatimonadota bacterium]
MKPHSLILIATLVAVGLGTTAFKYGSDMRPTTGEIDRPTAKLPLLAIDSLASPARPGSAEPNLTVAADGKVYLSWLEPANPGYALRFSVYDGAKWSPART